MHNGLGTNLQSSVTAVSNRFLTDRLVALEEYCLQRTLALEAS